jgi:hypothetical protein
MFPSVGSTIQCLTSSANIKYIIAANSSRTNISVHLFILSSPSWAWPRATNSAILPDFCMVIAHPSLSGYQTTPANTAAEAKWILSN